MISVIVPVYNAGAYLDPCIQSICAQTYSDLEIILIDDGSTDNSGELCDQFARKDHRIVVIHKANGGATSARKAGAEVAKGDEIVCIDSDDWVDSTYFAKLLAMRKETGADVVAADMYYVAGSAVSVQRNACQAGCYHSYEIWHEMISKGPFFEYGIQPHLVTKLFDRKLFCRCIQEIDERIIQGEDAALTYNCFLQDVKVCVCDICGYHYIQREDSVRTRYLSDEYERCLLLLEFLERIGASHHAGLTAQIERYKKYLLLLRCPSKLESGKPGQVLAPYGGIPVGSRIILYGAGYMGRTLYDYLTSSKKSEIIMWTDRNFEFYEKGGLAVMAPACIMEISGQYDFVIIAVASERLATSIKQILLQMGIAEGKIKWLSTKFVEG